MINVRKKPAMVFLVTMALALLFTLVQTIMPNSIMPGQAAWAARKAAGITYYVAPNGNDRAAGTRDAPFKTITKAARVVLAGDTVVVREGIYSGQVTFSRSGTQSAHITFKAADGECPKIVGNGSNYIFDFAGKSYIRVEGFDVSGSSSHMFRLENTASNGNVIANNIMHDTIYRGDGVRIKGAKNTQVLNNKMYYVQYGVKVERSSGGNSATNTVITGNEIYKPGVDCIYLAAPAVTVDKNYLHDNNETYKPDEHADGIQVYMAAYTPNSQFEFSNNIIDLNDQLGSPRQSNSMMLENAGGITIFNNVINCRNESNGINLKSRPDAKVFNNTLIDTNNYSIYVHTGSTVPSTNVKVYNNITPILKAPTNGSQIGYEAGNNLVGTDPMFVDGEAGDFRLMPGSPAIDNGYANIDNKLPYPATDIDGGDRIVNNMIDIGAYEYIPETGYSNKYEPEPNVFDGMDKLTSISEMQKIINEIKSYESADWTTTHIATMEAANKYS
jgi:hypothetical protein